MKIGIVQMPVGMDKAQNVACAVENIRRLANLGAQMVVLPEMFCCPYSNAYFREYAEEAGGMVYQSLSNAAKEAGVYLVGGSMPELDGTRVYNTCFVFAPDGSQIGRHRKMHLFDIDVKGGQRFMESETFCAGQDVTVVKTAFGDIGVCICFDYRFPELARLMALKGAKILVVPAAFNMTTGPAHWEITWRMRAVDNQVFSIGVAPARDENGVYVSYGNSIVVSPWGKVLYRADEKPASAVVEIDLNEVEAIREQLPLLKARRRDVYDLRQL